MITTTALAKPSITSHSYHFPFLWWENSPASESVGTWFFLLNYLTVVQLPHHSPELGAPCRPLHKLQTQPVLPSPRGKAEAHWLQASPGGFKQYKQRKSPKLMASRLQGKFQDFILISKDCKECNH